MKKLFSLTALFIFTLGAAAQDTTDCYLNTNFTYTIDGDYIYFTNTSTDEPAAANYEWWVSPLSSTDENPAFLIADLEDPTTACFTVFNDDWSCYDSLCMTIAFVEDSVVIIDSTDCYLNVTFTYTVDGDYVHFTNTSTDEPMGSNYSWWVNPLSSTDENPSFLISDLEDPTWACLTVYNDDWSCSDSICMTIAFEEDTVIVIDSTACFLNTSFSWEIDGDYIVFTNTSTDEPDGTIYDWWMGDSGSTDENPVFSIVGLGDSQEVCFTVHNWDWSCWDSLCTTIYFADSSGVSDSTAGIISNNKLDFNLYPNPASDNLTISFDNVTDSKQIFIYNALGELVRMEHVGMGENQFMFDVSELTKGFYIITVKDASQQELGGQQKFIKN